MSRVVPHRGGFRTIPKLRKCRTCWKNFEPAELVTERYHDHRGYPTVARWCPPCAAARLLELEADERCTSEAARLRSAIAEVGR